MTNLICFLHLDTLRTFQTVTIEKHSVFFLLFSQKTTAIMENNPDVTQPI